MYIGAENGLATKEFCHAMLGALPVKFQHLQALLDKSVAIGVTKLNLEHLAAP